MHDHWKGEHYGGTCDKNETRKKIFNFHILMK